MFIEDITKTYTINEAVFKIAFIEAVKLDLSIIARRSDKNRIDILTGRNVPTNNPNIFYSCLLSNRFNIDDFGKAEEYYNEHKLSIIESLEEVFFEIFNEDITINLVNDFFVKLLNDIPGLNLKKDDIVRGCYINNVVQFFEVYPQGQEL